MSREVKNISKTANLPPGSLIYTGEAQGQSIILTTYNLQEINSKKINNIEEFLEEKGKGIRWLDVIGLSNLDIIKELSKELNIHPLAQEDILNTTQSPKIDEYEDSLFLITKNIFRNDNGVYDSEHICMLLYPDSVITFQEYDTDSFFQIHQRLEEGKLLRNSGADDLMYALLDSIVDNYFLVIEQIGVEIDQVEIELLERPTKEILNKIYKIKRELVYLRNILWPMRNLTSALARGEYSLIDQQTIRYLGDVYNHIIQMIDIVETYRDICSGMLDTYLSSIGSKTNEVMKILTIFSAIFIPLTFLAGVYGMNFRFFPEIEWKYGYLGFWILSIIITAAMLRFLKGKGWL
ncbi:MAG: magnesium/cobalt transporter CorA [Clostridia bacterium]|nr:magnesium/cobalt transporter CorA [Clostridia bacterium]